MLNTQVVRGPTTEQADPPPINGVMAMLGITGEWVGTCVLYCNEKLACRLSSLMLQSEVGEINNEVLDGVGELANMVIGNLKDHLETAAGPLAMSIPTVVYGRNFQARTTGHRNWLIAPYQMDGDSFEIRICFAQKTATKRLREPAKTAP